MPNFMEIVTTNWDPAIPRTESEYTGLCRGRTENSYQIGNSPIKVHIYCKVLEDNSGALVEIATVHK